MLIFTLWAPKDPLELQLCYEDICVPGFIGDGTAGEHDLLGRMEAGFR